MVTDSSGNKVEGIAYYPYGQTRTDSGSVSVKHKYTGQELDSSTGLYFYNARYYDPSLGRFISADSIIPDPSDPQSFNRYSYVRNNPINLIDPSGHWSIKIGGTKISGDDKVLAAAIVVATGGAALAYGGPVLYGALIGEIAGGGTAMVTGGNVLTGVAIGGVMGAVGGYYMADPQYAMVADSSMKLGKAAEYVLSISDKLSIGLIGSGGTYMAFSAFGGGSGGHGDGGIPSTPTVHEYYGPGMIGHVPLDQAIQADMGLIMGMTSPLGSLGGIARTEARNLAEQLTVMEAKSGAGERIMQGRIKDPRFHEDTWAKMQHVHTTPDGQNIVIHFWHRLVDGFRTGFKFKD